MASPGEDSTQLQSIDFFKTLGGVPVLRRPVSKPKERNASVSPIDEPSPILPALKDLFPMWISPLRNVPEVIIRAGQFILSPDLRVREETAPLLTSKATTSPSIILIFWSLSIRDLTNLGYFFLSVCTRSDWTARPFDILRVLNWIPAWSAAIDIIPPRASISWTKWLLASPPIAGLHDILAVAAASIVTITTFKPILEIAKAASMPACPPPTI